MKALFVAAAVFAFAVSCACACERVLTHAEISADRSRAVEFSSPSLGSRFGQVVNAAGDLNGDGLGDFAIVAPLFGSSEGAVFVVFGRSSSAWSNATFDFAAAETPDPASWIRISGTGGMYLGDNGIAPGDFNGDGVSDLIISAANGGKAFVVYGRRGNWSSFSTAEIESGAVPGFAIVKTPLSQRFVGNAGDLNGDGIEDMLFSNISVGLESFVFVVFGVAGSSRSAFDVGSIDGSNGFSLHDGTVSLGEGDAMGSVGDINGDGLADLALGSSDINSNDGRAYILFARNVSATGQQWAASLNPSTDLDGTNGFFIDGTAYLGSTVVGAGDVNADGFADIFIGTSLGVSGGWLVLGHPAPWVSPFNISELSGTEGFHFTSASGESWGYSGGGAGDVNGDGFDDLVIGGYKAFNSSYTVTGAAAIIFGRAGSWPAEISRNDAVGSVGFLIEGPSQNSQFGFSARGAGDVNGDGLADFVAGAWYVSTQSGYAVLVFGVADHCAVCSNTTDACLACDDGFFLNGTLCEKSSEFAASSSSPETFSSSAHHQQGVSVVVIIRFLEDVTDPTELEEEIASALGIDAGLVSVVVISPTEVEVTIIGNEETAQRLVDIINNGGAGDGSGLGLLRKAIDAHIRKDADDNGSSGDDGVDAANALLCPLLIVAIFVLLL